jgi:hypothetical protein
MVCSTVVLLRGPRQDEFSLPARANRCKRAKLSGGYMMKFVEQFRLGSNGKIAVGRINGVSQ